LDKKADFSKLRRLCRSAALISLKVPDGVAYFALTARGANILGPRIGESASFVVGEDGGLIVLASEAGTPTLVTLETDDTDW
jgi:hypothetical protein